MTETVYGLLDQNARAWWYHRRLREWGKLVEARVKERRSIRNNLKCIKEARDNGGYMILAVQWQLRMDDGHTLTGYDIDGPFVRAVLLAGIPVIDARENPGAVISAPMIGVRKVDPPPWGWLSHAPLEVVVEHYLERGASVANMPEPKNVEPDSRICGSCGHELIAHYNFVTDSWCGCLECGCVRWWGFDG